MKNNLKKLFKTGILFLSLAFLTYSCQKDDTSENIESSDEIQNILSQKISLNEIPNSNQVSEVLRNLSTSINANNYLQRTIEPDSVSIDTNDILYMEYGNTHTLTFKLLANNPQYYIENIVLHYNVDTDSYDEYLLEYVITQEEFVDFSNGIPLNENTEVLITELDTGTVSTILGRSSCSRNCETIYVQCTAGGQHWPGEECTGNPNQVAYSYQECTITCNDDPTVTVISAGPSGGGGGGNPNDDDVITNPNTNEPCDTSSGTIGITGNDGCITTVDDEARNQLFDRLATYMTSQDQADWIVLEANIDIINNLNDFLDEASFNNQAEYKNKAINFVDIFLTYPNTTWILIEDWFLNKVDFVEPDLGINPDNISYDAPLTEQSLPSFSNFVEHFPKNGTSGNYSVMDTSDVYELVGGSLWTSHQNNPSAYSNACSIRGSRGLNYSGIDIPVLNYPGVGQRTQKGGDLKNYILDAVSFDKFMRDKFGDATYELTGSDANDPIKVAEVLNGKNGIYVIINSSHAQAGYSGHVDAIINGDCISDAYTDVDGGVKSIRIWELN